MILTGGFLLIFSLLNQVDIMKDISTIRDGKYTITQESIDDQKLISLTGEWSFYPNLFISDDGDLEDDVCKGPLMTPGSWFDKKIGNTMMGAYGYGTYQLILYNNSEYSDFQLYFPSSILEAYKVVINGKEVAEIGEIGVNKSSSKPRYESVIIDLNDSNRIKIQIQVSNFHFESGGMRKPVFLGRNGDIQSLVKFNFAKDIFVLGLLCGFTLYFGLTLLKIRRNGRALVYLIYGLFVAIMYTITSNEMVVLDFFPNVSFRIQDMMQYMLALSGGSVFVILIDVLFKNESNKVVKNICIIKMGLFVFLNVVLERQVITQFMNLFSVVSILEFMYGIYVLSKASKYNKVETYPLLIGTAILMSTIIYDVLYVSQIQFSPYGVMTSIGLVAFILSFAIVIAIQYERSFQEVSILSDKLIETELGKLSAQINPHFISNAMIAVSEHCYNEPLQAAEVALDLADYLRFIFSYDYKIKEIEIEKELELVKTYLRIEKARFANDLMYDIDFEERNVMVPPFSIQTVVENAVKHGIRQKKDGGTIKILGYSDGSYYHIEVIDTGMGIKEEDIPTILAGEKYSGTGIGLAYVDKSIQNLYGTKLTIESKYMEGTTISFKVRNRGV